MDKLKMHSPDLTAANITKLGELFPNCVTEAKDAQGELKKSIDFDLLRQELSTSIVEGPQERYQLNWPGKREALLTANAPIAKTLRPCREESVDFDSTQNLFIEGDNLDALKLLQETYLNKVKMIYIDPPYNTGNDFVYKDDFSENSDDFLFRSNQKDSISSRLVANLDTSGRFHSNWLSMIYPRIKHSRNLLKDDGVIFISIDDGEFHNLKSMCDEIFGVDCHVGTIVWKNKYGAGAKTKGFIDVHEYILCYSKSNIGNITSALSDDQQKAYNKRDEKYEVRGGYFTQPLMTTSMDDRANLQYPIEYNGDVIKPKKQWVWSQERLLAGIEKNEVVFNKQADGSYSVRRKVYLYDEDGSVRKGKPISLLNGPFNQEGTKEVDDLLDAGVFSFPKPTALIEFLFGFEINDQVDKDGIYLDFFAGSGTSANAVMQLNARDGFSRRFISIQVAEECDQKTGAFKLGYKTVAEISKERLRRAGQKIKQGNADKPNIEDLDTGFRVLKIDTSNMNEVYYTPDAVSQEALPGLVDNIRADRSAEDLLFQVLLDWGVDLALPISRQTIAGKTVFFVDADTLAACFETGIDEDFVKQLAARKPLRVVFRDAGFVSDSVKINVEQVFKLLSPATEIKTL